MSYAGRQGRRGLLDRILKGHRELLRRDDHTWGQVAWAMMEFKDYAGARDWLADWRERHQAPAWALNNAAFAHASCRDLGGATEVAEVVLSRFPGNADARLWRCVGLAVRGEHGLLGEGLGQDEDWPTDDWMKPWLGMLRGYLAAVQSGESSQAVDAFRLALPHRQSSPALSYAITILGRHLLKHHTPGWLVPWRWLMLGCG